MATVKGYKTDISSASLSSERMEELWVDQCDGETVVLMRQKGFIDGRLETIPISKERKQDLEAHVSKEEQTDFRSVLGSLQWLATQSRPDVSFGVNQLQKRVNDLRVRDLDAANRLVKVVRSSSKEERDRQCH